MIKCKSHSLTVPRFLANNFFRNTGTDLDLDYEIDLSKFLNKTLKKEDIFALTEKPELLWAIYCLLTDLALCKWKIKNGGYKDDMIEIELIKPSQEFTKQEIRDQIFPRKLEKIRKNIKWIKNNEESITRYFVNPKDLNPSKVTPIVQECNSREKMDIYRYCRFLSSVPYSDHVGRRMSFLIRDASLSNLPIIGIAAIGSSVYQMRSRDEWVGWYEAKYKEVKKERITNILDLYTSVAIPPYNFLLGGKLVSSMMISNEIGRLYRKKYFNQSRENSHNNNDVALIETTNYFGLNSSQYNRLNFEGRQLYIPIGTTTGYGSAFISDRTFDAFLGLLKTNGLIYQPNLTTGSNWRLRVIRYTYRFLCLEEDYFLNSPVRRGIYVAPLAENASAFLRGESNNLKYYNSPLSGIVEFWKKRWLCMRSTNQEVMEKVRNYDRRELILSRYCLN